ncbi:MAG TPA: hypothetical protein VK002_16310 [Rubricoccaceae bacterium]|nr:hypothetical protein [Rubricoccaceae bacterium]
MPTCSTCGNDYDRAFTVITHDEQSYTFDSFECAIYALAPTCKHCGVRIIGHGMQQGEDFFCCAHCAEAEGVQGLEDRV